MGQLATVAVQRSLPVATDPSKSGISRLREEMEEGEAQRGFAKAAVEAPAQLYVSVSVSVKFSL